MNSLLFSLRQKRAIKYFTFDDSTRGWDIGVWQLEEYTTKPSILQLSDSNTTSSFKLTSAKPMNNQLVFSFSQDTDAAAINKKTE